MAMQTPRFLGKVGRLFVIKTRWEAWLVTWAIALGAVERGKAYLAIYPGALGWMFFALCTGVVFIAGAKLLDAVTPKRAAATVAIRSAPRRLSRNRPRSSRRPAGSAPRRSFHRD